MIAALNFSLNGRFAVVIAGAICYICSKGDKVDYTLEKLKKFDDERGFLIEFLKNSELAADKKPFGQIYLATIKPGLVRGNHFHRTKDEYFTVMNGLVSVVVEDIETKEREEFEIDSSKDTITRLRVGPGVAHAFKNIGASEVVLTAYTDKEYDADSLDQEPYELI